MAPFLRSLLATVLGILVSFLVAYVTADETTFSKRSVASHIGTTLFGLLGGLVAWTIAEMLVATYLLRSELRHLRETREFYGPAEKILSLAKRHTATVRKLLLASVKDNIPWIPYTNIADYREFLMSAIRDSKKYLGIKRGPARSFLPNNGGSDVEGYLRTLRDKNMSEKIRLFVIDDTDVQRMKEDLDNEELMSFYWTNNGTEVHTFWCSLEELKKEFPTIEAPQDCGIYDMELMIGYDSDRQVLRFDLVDRDIHNWAGKLYESLKVQIEKNNSEPFHRVLPRLKARRKASPKKRK